MAENADDKTEGHEGTGDSGSDDSTENADDRKDGKESEDDKESKDDGKDTKKTSYTAEEFQAELQRRVDQRVSQALQTQQKKLEQEAERERLKQAGEYKQLSERFEQQLSEERSERERAQLQAGTVDLLQSNGLPEFKAIFEADTSTLEGREALIGRLKELVDGAVERKVSERLKTKVPGTKGKSTDKTETPGRLAYPSMEK